jgi:hypothetical protein
MARLTGLEPATPGVTGRYSNRLSYNRALDGHLCDLKSAVKHLSQKTALDFAPQPSHGQPAQDP